MLPSAAMFSVPATDTLAEGDTPFDACVTLASGSASLAVQLVVSLTTFGTSGER